MTTEQKLREALQAVIAAHDACMRELGEQMRAANITNFRVDGQAAIDSFAAIEQARQALATTAPAVNQQLTTEPADEREAFEREMKKRLTSPLSFDRHEANTNEYAYLTTAVAWYAWQARAAMAHGEAMTDTVRYRVWPDGTVQDYSEGNPYAWKSDDYALIDAESPEQAIVAALREKQGGV